MTRYQQQHDATGCNKLSQVDQASFVSCLNSTGTQGHICRMEKVRRGASTSIGVNIDQSLANETSSDVKNTILLGEIDASMPN